MADDSGSLFSDPAVSAGRPEVGKSSGGRGAGAGGGVTATSLKELRGKTTEIATLSSLVAKSIVPPGHMAKDEANSYMTKIHALFSPASELEVQATLAAWAAIHDVGGTQDFAGKPPIVVGNKSIQPSEVFGEIIPVGSEGKPRQFCATMFEENFDVVLEIVPQLRTILASRCAQAGLPVGEVKSVVSYLKGVTPGTVGTNAARTAANATLLAHNARSKGANGAQQTARDTSLVVQEVTQAGSGHDLGYHTNY
jgi:hypothetical protein